MTIQTSSRSMQTAKKLIPISLQAGDVIEIKKNGVVVEDFTVPANKIARGHIAVDLTLA